MSILRITWIHGTLTIKGDKDIFLRTENVSEPEDITEHLINLRSEFNLKKGLKAFVVVEHPSLHNTVHEVRLTSGSKAIQYLETNVKSDDIAYSFIRQPTNLLVTNVEKEFLNRLIKAIENSGLNPIWVSTMAPILIDSARTVHPNTNKVFMIHESTGSPITIYYVSSKNEVIYVRTTYPYNDVQDIEAEMEMTVIHANKHFFADEETTVVLIGEKASEYNLESGDLIQTIQNVFDIVPNKTFWVEMMTGNLTRPSYLDQLSDIAFAIKGIVSVWEKTKGLLSCIPFNNRKAISVMLAFSVIFVSVDLFEYIRLNKNIKQLSLERSHLSNSLNMLDSRIQSLRHILKVNRPWIEPLRIATPLFIAASENANVVLTHVESNIGKNGNVLIDIRGNAGNDIASAAKNVSMYQKQLSTWMNIVRGWEVDWPTQMSSDGTKKFRILGQIK
ncbi:MAG: hypothetical protein D6732_22075 [Methanobacteriota archaeon]|nr:MAG: hypothetical protein D6732_22075 [Euryarchaeota archaeon]